MDRYNKLITLAENYFMQGNFDLSMQTYALILKEFPSSEEAKVGALLSDLGNDSSEEAHAIFEYYHVIKHEDQDALESVEAMLDSISRTKAEVAKVLVEPFQDEIEPEDGISYSDFIQAANNKGGIKRALEDLLFSSKVVITQKEDFVDFVNRLINEGLEEIAMEYLEVAELLFGNDKEVMTLFYKLGKE